MYELEWIWRGATVQQSTQCTYHKHSTGKDRDSCFAKWIIESSPSCTVIFFKIIFPPTDLCWAYLVTVKEHRNSVQLFLIPDGWGRRASREDHFYNLSYERMLWAELCQEFYGLMLRCTLAKTLLYHHKYVLLSKTDFVLWNLGRNNTVWFFLQLVFCL